MKSVAACLVVFALLSPAAAENRLRPVQAVRVMDMRYGAPIALPKAEDAARMRRIERAMRRR